ncbi:hypothetical protein H1V43_38355 [Streptomyces sp. PSKA54]|uniref:Uncharacterized protein n=1 Tax=Streptomyces himalayensis subsp. aureolus TaxID=2758039 RepID=A0A7W2D9F7_9ACTN|nr:hypothetical protein [Streptomyces himalayensis]MBA4867053.1 hypothetical protein [Streptomyces himalayensis subsp. aureolus]
MLVQQGGQRLDLLFGQLLLVAGGIPDEAMWSARGCRPSANVSRADLQRLTVAPLTQTHFA